MKKTCCRLCSLEVDTETELGCEMFTVIGSGKSAALGQGRSLAVI